MIYQDQLSVEQLVALNMGDEDWEELAPSSDDGCSRKATTEPDRFARTTPELEPMYDKYRNHNHH